MMFPVRRRRRRRRCAIIAIQAALLLLLHLPSPAHSANGLGRCQKSGCRTSPDDGVETNSSNGYSSRQSNYGVTYSYTGAGSGSGGEPYTSQQPHTPRHRLYALVVEWITVFSFLRLFLYLRMNGCRHFHRRLLQAKGRAANSLDRWASSTVRGVSAVRSRFEMAWDNGTWGSRAPNAMSNARRRQRGRLGSRGNSANSLGSLADLVAWDSDRSDGSDDDDDDGEGDEEEGGSYDSGSFVSGSYTNGSYTNTTPSYYTESGSEGTTGMAAAAPSSSSSAKRGLYNSNKDKRKNNKGRTTDGRSYESDYAEDEDSYYSEGYDSFTTTHGSASTRSTLYKFMKHVSATSLERGSSSNNKERKSPHSRRGGGGGVGGGDGGSVDDNGFRSNGRGFDRPLRYDARGPPRRSTTTAADAAPSVRNNAVDSVVSSLGLSAAFEKNGMKLRTTTTTTTNNPATGWRVPQNGTAPVSGGGAREKKKKNGRDGSTADRVQRIRNEAAGNGRRPTS